MSQAGEAIIYLARSFPDMTMRQAAILLNCAQTENVIDRQVCELSARFGWTRPVISRIGFRLQEMGLIDRGQLPGDMRTCTFTVTRTGHRTIQKALGEPEERSGKRKREAPAKVFPAIV